jgi:cellulose synthase/poly-beta-1,6-N-acetylglucosamine synthase-like glycosyltransferase
MGLPAEMVLTVTVLLLVLMIYVYVGYPVVLYLLSRVFGNKARTDSNHLPPVTLIVSCFNEAAVVEAKVANCRALDYPAGSLEIIFVSDGSTDDTDELIKPHCGDNIRLIRQEGRLGKTSGLNLAVAEAKGEVVVFSDANAMYAPDAIKMLVRNFIDLRIGYVVGAAIYTDGSQNAAAKSEDSYWQYELQIKRFESELHSVVGGDGAIYAIRKHLYQELEQQDISDFVNPLQIIAQGFRGVFDPDAMCFEKTAGDFRKEARRKERIVNRSFRGLMKVSEVMNPLKTGVFAFEVISHKLLRWLVPLMLVGIAFGSIWLAYAGSGFFRLLYLVEVMFLWLAIVGFLKQRQEQISPLFFYPYYFLMVNFYSLLGIAKALAGDIQVTWESPRASQDADMISAGQKVTAIGLGLVNIFILIGVI